MGGATSASMAAMKRLLVGLAVLAGCAGNMEPVAPAPSTRVLRHDGQRPVQLSAEDFRAAVEAVTGDLPAPPPLSGRRLRAQLAAVNPAGGEGALRDPEGWGRGRWPGGDLAG